MKKDNVIVSLLVVLIVATTYGIFRNPVQSQSSQNIGGAQVCTVTQRTVNIGHQLSTQILAKGARAWAIIQQPLNATNTVALSLDNASSTLASGYKLYPTVSASTTDNFRLGFATDLPTSNAVEAITSTGSTTITVIECK